MMEQLPLVSICIPNYNNAQFICEAIQSSIDQTYPNLEIIVVDNVSTDNSWEIIQRYAQHKNVKVYQNEENLGMVGNFRRTLEHSTGELITYLCGDDYLSKSGITENVAILQKYPEASFVFGNIEYHGSRKGQSDYKFKELIPNGEWTKSSLEKSKNLSFLTGTIFRKNAALNIEGPIIEELTFFDWFLWLRLGLVTVAFNSKIVGIHRYHDTNQTELLTPGLTENFKQLLEVLKLLRKYYPSVSGIVKAENKLSCRYAILAWEKSGLHASMKFAKKYANCYYSCLAKLLATRLYSIARKILLSIYRK